MQKRVANFFILTIFLSLLFLFPTPLSASSPSPKQEKKRNSETSEKEEVSGERIRFVRNLIRENGGYQQFLASGNDDVSLAQIVKETKTKEMGTKEMMTKEMRTKERSKEEEITKEKEIENQIRLRSVLFENYTRNIPPGREIQLDYFLYDLFGVFSVDIIGGTYRVMGAAGYGWVDSRLTWDPLDYDNMTSLALDSGNLGNLPEAWLAEVAPYPIVTDSKTRDFLITYFVVNYTGAVHVGIITRIDLFCFFSTRWFPFDKHICQLSFVRVVPTFLPNDSYFYSNVPSPITSQDYKIYAIDQPMVSNGVATATGIPNGSVTAFVFIERASTQYIIRFILPIILFTLLSFGLFIQDSNNGERIGLSFNILLSIVALNFVVADLIPPSLVPTFVDIVSLVSMVFVLAVIVESGFVLELYGKEGAFFFNRKRDSKRMVFDKEPGEIPPDFRHDLYLEKVSWLIAVCHNTSLIGYLDVVNPDAINRKIERVNSHRHVARQLDRVSFIVAMSLYTIFLVVYVPYSVNTTYLDSLN